jgi:hypothetical protein
MARTWALLSNGSAHNAARRGEESGIRVTAWSRAGAQMEFQSKLELRIFTAFFPASLAIP